MILVCGLPNEPPIEFLVRALQQADAEFMLLDQARFSDYLQCHWMLGDNGLSGRITYEDRVVELADIQAVYTRFMPVENLCGIADDPRRIEDTRALTNSLCDLFDVIPARVVNPRRAMMSNNSKPYQAMIIRDVGFAVPETVITNQFDSVAAFQTMHGELIYKSTSAVRSIVKTLQGRELDRLQQVRNLPTQFQRRIRGFNVRVHVVGNKVYACKIATDATDYRYASLDEKTAAFSSYELDRELRRRCLHLAERCGMSFVGIDLIVGEEGIFCLEVNPSPAYSYYESATGAPISRALARLLAQSGSPRKRIEDI